MDAENKTILKLSEVSIESLIVDCKNLHKLLESMCECSTFKILNNLLYIQSTDTNTIIKVNYISE
jgi:hypothetical protein